ncbi:hypothetical protein B0T18DRAFT_419731 [Schizothecium vesticola]|uniref:Uncharacterized protein n=1 Tax=Schizothecium vesticola TaxID=314040 RepID=A0AA40EKZ4_9PEZI|nr:hypothetical protein B0T18DRAFT_419731 [Schizothecium vesticola]
MAVVVAVSVGGIFHRPLPLSLLQPPRCSRVPYIFASCLTQPLAASTPGESPPLLHGITRLLPRPIPSILSRLIPRLPPGFLPGISLPPYLLAAHAVVRSMRREELVEGVDGVGYMLLGVFW